MSTSTTQLPSLSPENRATLLRYFSLRENPEALAAALNQDLISIYEWLTSPAISPWLALHREHKARALQDSLQSTLHKLLDKPLNLIEARRTATTLLRSLHIATRAPRAHQRPAAPAHATSPPPRTDTTASAQQSQASSCSPSLREVAREEPSLQSQPPLIPSSSTVFSRASHSPIQSLITAAGRAPTSGP